MTPFADFVTLCRQLEAAPGRLEKRRLTAAFLSSVEPEEIRTAVAFLTGRPFPPSDPRVLGVRWLPRLGAESPVSRESGGPGLTLGDVRSAFADVADASGPGSRRARDARLVALASRASDDEREILGRIVGGEMRTGVSEGVVLEAIAAMGGADAGRVRRAALFLGDLAAVAELVKTGGAAALASIEPRLFVPLLPMLAEIAADVGEVLAAHGGASGLEYKYDGARIQVHKHDDQVRIWSRRLSDVTASLPDVVALVRRELPAGPLILDGEVIALDRAGQPLAFQELMRRFRRVHDVDTLVADVPLALKFFDCLVRDGCSMIDHPCEERWTALARVTGGRFLADRAVVDTTGAAQAFLDAALAAGHEGVMAKDLRSAYEPGGRGKRWLKVKRAETVDCVILAADRGSGRRVGWLSNYHLGVRDGDGYADVGKTFKGLTDAEFTAMTDRLRALAIADDGYTVRVRPEVVVEVEYNEVQKSPTYASGFALRFARIARIRDDKDPGQVTTLDELGHLYERQFSTKGRRV
jgi:DNA ligase-1